jgi:hypothetical protein
MASYSPVKEDQFDYREEEWSAEEESEGEAEGEPQNPWGIGIVESKDQSEKPRPRRTGYMPLNIIKSYGLLSGWGVRQGIRELLQNLYQPSFYRLYVSVDNVRTNADGTAREVEWAVETADGITTYLAFEKGRKPRPNPKTKLLNKTRSLGYIIYQEGYGGKLVLVNRETKLSRQAWSIGQTTKGNGKHQIGGHGT